MLDLYIFACTGSNDRPFRDLAIEWKTLRPHRAVQLTLVAELTYKPYGDKNHDVDIAGNNTHKLQQQLRDWRRRTTTFINNNHFAAQIGAGSVQSMVYNHG